MKHILVLLFVMIFTVSANAQISFNAGATMIKGFRAGTDPNFGFHLGMEFPRDDFSSFYVRYTLGLKQYANDSVTNIQLDPINDPFLPYASTTAIPSMNYHIIEGGNRYYIGDGFDFGWGGYGGSSFLIMINQVKAKYGSFDESKYKIADFSRMEGTILSLGAGLNGGVKYTDPRIGSFYFDVGLSYMFFAQSNHPNVYGGLYSSLIFSFNLGYRKDLIW